MKSQLCLATMLVEMSDPQEPDQSEASSEQDEKDSPVVTVSTESKATAESSSSSDALIDRWWVWALGGLGIAAFFGLLHVLT